MVCKFDIKERNFLLLLFLSLYITQVLTIIFPLKWFYYDIVFYTKYFVLSYSIVVVSTLSYLTTMKMKINLGYMQYHIYECPVWNARLVPLPESLLRLTKH